MDDEGVLCVSCGVELTGKYCAQCGERVLARDEYRLSRFLADAARDVTSVDAKLYRTLWLLVRRPGRLTLEYIRGKRVPYLRPIQLFLLANLVYFLIQPLSGYSGFNTTLAGQMSDQFYSRAIDVRERVAQRISEQGVSAEEYEETFNRSSSLYARSLTALMVPLFSLAAALVFATRRKPLFNHVVFATHFMAWQLLVVMSAFLLLLRLSAPYLSALFELGTRAGLPGMDFLAFFIGEFGSALLVVPYLYFAVGELYGRGRLYCARAALILTALLLPVMLVYRFVLFWLTFATV